MDTTVAVVAAAKVASTDYSDDAESTGSILSYIISLMQLESINSLLIDYSDNWSNLASLIIMRPQTLAFIIVIFIVFTITHNFEAISALITSRLCKSHWFQLLRLSNGDSSINSEVVSALFKKGLNDVYELRAAPKVAIFGIRGRRGKMEDKFDYINETSKLGIEMYAVFDGHGSDKAANFISKNLLKAIRDRIENAIEQDESMQCKAKTFKESICEQFKESEEEDDSNERADGKCRSRILGKMSSLERAGDVSKNDRRVISTQSIVSILREEILSIDEKLMQFAKDENDFGGSTAVIAVRLHHDNKLLVANVGDSRAVLCNGHGVAIPLSHDHKPQNPDEHKRIVAAGGFIRFAGVWRVAGILALSRALGNYNLKRNNWITAEPDTLTFDLSKHQPQFLILASDGLWDTFSNEDAVKFVREYINNSQKKAASTDELAYNASKALVYEAYKRLSLDNITVIIVIFDPKEFTPSIGFARRRYASFQI